MILSAVILGGAALLVIVVAVFVILVIGVQVTDRHASLRAPSHDSRVQALARRVLGVYVRRTAGQPGHESHPARCKAGR